MLFRTGAVDAARRLGGRASRSPTLQMVATGRSATPTTDASSTLGAADVPEMLALVARTKPGPFAQRTVELGTYLGLRADDGTLVAMTGERMQPAGLHAS